MRFFSFFGSKNAQKCLKMPYAQVLFDFRQLLFYDLLPKNASKYPKIEIFLLLAFLREMRFLALKMPSCLVLFDFRQLLFYYLPQKNASKYPKIAIFRFANTVIFKFGQL